jgi:hypothetical protein
VSQTIWDEVMEMKKTDRRRRAKIRTERMVA